MTSTLHRLEDQKKHIAEEHAKDVEKNLAPVKKDEPKSLPRPMGKRGKTVDLTVAVEKTQTKKKEKEASELEEEIPEETEDELDQYFDEYCQRVENFGRKI